NYPTEYVDKNGFYVRILQNDPETSFYRSGIRSTTHVEEVRRLATRQFDDVHSGHCQTSAIYHTPDVAVQLHVIQVSFAGFNLQGIFFRQVTQLHQILMTIQRVVVEVNFRINGEDPVVGGFQKGIDLEHGSVESDISIIKGMNELDAFLERVTFPAQSKRDFARLKGL